MKIKGGGVKISGEVEEGFKKILKRNAWEDLGREVWKDVGYHLVRQ